MAATTRDPRIKHGAYVGGGEAPTHYVWRSMIARCRCPTHHAWSRYGGRGITVCKRWLSYENFVVDMGYKPEGMSLDRIDNDGHYNKSNCRWADRSTQQKNRRTTKFYTNGTFTGTLVECAAFVGISKELALWRFKTHQSFCRRVLWQQLPPKIERRRQ